MICIAIMLVIQASIQLSLILDIYLGNGASKQRAEDWFHANATVAVVVVMAIFLFFNLGALSLILQLLMFHIRLRKEGLSTYTFIVRDNQRRREKARKEDELKLRRQMEIAHAKTAGNRWQVLRLEQGGFLRESCGLVCCDPLKLEDEESAEKARATSATISNGHAPPASNGTGTSGQPDDDED